MRANVFSLNDALALTPAQLVYFYEEQTRDTAARRAAAVIDTLAAISAISGTEHVQEHLDSLAAIAAPSSAATDGSYTKGSNNTNVIEI